MLVLRESSKCVDSAADKITQSPYLLRFVTTILSEVPAFLSFGTGDGGADRVSVKNRSENSDCMELAHLIDFDMDRLTAQ